MASETRNWGKSTLNWHSETELEGNIVNYAYYLNYANGKNANKPESLEVQFGFRRKLCRKDPVIRLVFDDSGVSEITYRDTDSGNWNHLPPLLKRMLAKKVGGEKASQYAEGWRSKSAMFHYGNAQTIKLRETPLAIVGKVISGIRTEKVFNQKLAYLTLKKRDKQIQCGQILRKMKLQTYKILTQNTYSNFIQTCLVSYPLNKLTYKVNYLQSF